MNADRYYEQNVCLAWDETVEWAALLDLQTVPVHDRTRPHWWQGQAVVRNGLAHAAPDA